MNVAQCRSFGLDCHIIEFWNGSEQLCTEAADTLHQDDDKDCQSQFVMEV